MDNLHNGPAGSARKRRKRERAFRLESFCETGYPAEFRGTFLENVKELVGFGRREDDTGGGGGVQCWSFNLEAHRCPSACLRMYVAEETVEMSACRHCHYCRSVGWGHHMICNKRFHFMLPSKGSSMPQMEDLSIYVSNKSCTQSHLLHGVVHSNGFGHLIFINGVEGGSEFLSGREILDLWDRICTALQMRKVSVTDVAKKGSMELRLIHGLAYGQPWFGRWGYEFGRGSYGVTLQTYRTSLEVLRGLSLSLLVPHFGRDVPLIVAKYQTVSGHTLSTLSDLLRFMLELDRRLPRSSPSALDFNGIVSESACRWSAKRVEMAAQVIVDALKKSASRWVPRQDVRDAARAYIGDTGLLDYVLKSLGNHIVGDYIVRRMVNPVTKLLEYCLQDVSSVLPRLGRVGSVMFRVTRAQLKRDLFFLYKQILREQNRLATTIPMAVRVVLDTKHLVKDYGGDSTHRAIGSRGVTCTVRTKKGLLPYETVAVPTGATVSDLRREAETRFKDLYLGLKNFVADSVANADDCEAVGNLVVVEGRFVGDADEMYEGGNAVGVLECRCGAKEEDGERTVCCDICEVRQHARCAGVADEGEDVARVFLCGGCESGILALPPIHYLD